MEIPWQRVSIAPMMDITDRRFRYFIRLINPQVKLYTEMIVAHAIVRGDRQKLLAFDHSEHPVVLQLGGDDPDVVSEAAAIGEAFGYDGIDLNCGCPSDRVESGNFGVCLMRTPQQVADIVAAMRRRIRIPVSVKCRIGINGEESEAGLTSFAAAVFAAGAASLTVHARTAVLGGLSPKQNREVPPLDYEMVYRLKRQFPDREMEINGGIRTREAIRSHLLNIDRVMIGRLAHEDPWFFSENPAAGISARFAVMAKMAEYASTHESSDMTAARFFANMLNIFHALPGARFARRFLCEQGRSLSPAAAIAQLSENFTEVGA